MVIIMKKELDEKFLNNIAGGTAYVDVDGGRVAWDNVKGVYKLKNCTPYEAAAAMAALRGVYPTEKEYDEACYQLLKDKGWI